VNIAYLDAFSGVAGDMLLGACVDAGAPLATIDKALRGLPLEGWSLKQETVQRAGLRATRVVVETDETHVHRRYDDVASLLAAGGLDEPVHRRALAVFEALFRAEARVHGSSFEKVHLHEAGAVDAIVDVVGTVVGLEALGVKRLEVSPLPLGGGTIQAAHGTLPVPAPAVAELLKGLPVRGGPVESELVTPTGAALVTTLADAFGPLPAMRLETIGIGAGTRETAGRANVCRLLVGRAPQADDQQEQTVTVIEANIDDLSPQVYGHLIDRLLEAGALDASVCPLIMKKGRPGVLLQLLAPTEQAAQLQAMVFAETTTLGLRRYEARRSVLGRRMETVDTPWGSVSMKVSLRDGAIHDAQPEYEDARAVALRAGVPLRRVQAAALEAWSRRMNGPSGS
jgi:uncharacterized protein (TIGR00299 family) protein